MRRRFSDRVWPSLGTKALIFGALAPILLTSCSLTPAHYNPLRESSVWMERTPTPMEKTLARSDFSIELASFVDSRRPENPIIDQNDKVMYTYDPESLLRGVSVQVPTMMRSYLSYRSKTAKNYMVEVELLRLTTYVKTGTLLSGSWGRYATEVEVLATVRRADSTPVLSRHYRQEREEPRKTHNGRSPTSEHDRSILFQMVEESFRKISENIGWDIRSKDSSRWVLPPEPTPNPEFFMAPDTGARVYDQQPSDAYVTP